MTFGQCRLRFQHGVRGKMHMGLCRNGTLAAIATGLHAEECQQRHVTQTALIHCSPSASNVCDSVVCRKPSTTTFMSQDVASTTPRKDPSAWRSCHTSPSSTTPSAALCSSTTSAIAQQCNLGSLQGPSLSCRARGLLLLLLVQLVPWR
jgi:hypothetical protein